MALGVTPSRTMVIYRASAKWFECGQWKYF
jgi:hypothetical protein